MPAHPQNPPPAQPQRPPKKRELADWIERSRPEVIGETEWDALRALLAPISESYLRRLLRDSGVPLAPIVEGVRQESLDALESSLLKLLAEYEAGDAAQRAQVRRLVITAKDHARLAARNVVRTNLSKTARTGPARYSKEDNDPFTATAPGSVVRANSKEEMILWMLTWLENPPLFPAWVRLRRAALSGEE